MIIFWAFLLSWPLYMLIAVIFIFSVEYVTMFASPMPPAFSYHGVSMTESELI